MTIEDFIFVPVGSLIAIEDQARRYTMLERFAALPPNSRLLASDLKTGAYIKGLARIYGVAEENGWKLSFSVLRLLVGDFPLHELSRILGQEVGLAADKAAALAADIEKELIAPVALELNAYWASLKTGNDGGATRSFGSAQDDNGGPQDDNGATTLDSPVKPGNDNGGLPGQARQ